jgi:hypothetical protein
MTFPFERAEHENVRGLLQVATETTNCAKLSCVLITVKTETHNPKLVLLVRHLVPGQIPTQWLLLPDAAHID